MKSSVSPIVVAFVLITFCIEPVLAQRSGGRPPARKHTVTSSTGELKLQPSNSYAPDQSMVIINQMVDKRVIRSNGIPKHKVGRFPNSGNPNAIQAQKYAEAMPIKPKTQSMSSPLPRGPFGFAVNGVPFDPGAAEWYQGVRSSTWQYEALSGAVPLGLDTNHGHVQPTGAYHYHGLPTGLLKSLKVTKGEHSPIVGWAADGFPIYAMYGYSSPDDPNSAVIELSSSYVLKSGNRPGGNNTPDGKYDGTFVGDYEFKKGNGHLDDCNGRFCVTPDFPNGTYAYFLTQSWPVIPRRFKGIPNEGVQHVSPNNPPPRRGDDRRPPPHHRRPPPR